MSMHLYLASNPRRPVNWRYERARQIAEGGHPLHRTYDDRWVHKAYRFRQAFEACHTEADHVVCAYKYPDLYWAHDLSFTITPESGNPFKSELEARLLAGDEYPNIALRLATTVPVVEAYEKVFFNIEERRQNRGYLIHQVIGPAVYLGLNEQEYDVLWKLVALWGGPFAVDMMIDGALASSRPTNPADVGAWLTDSIQSAIRRKVLMAALMIKVNNFTAVPLLEQFIKLLEVERQAGRGTAGTEGLLNHVDAMLKALPIQVGGRVTHVDVPELDQYDNQRAELRYEEMIAVGLGRDLPVRDVLHDYAFPPPPESADAA